MTTLSYYLPLSPTETEIERGEYRGYGYVIGEEAGKTVLYIFRERDIANITVFGGKNSVSLEDSKGETRVLERKSQDNQMVFRFRYEESVSLERVKDDLAAFVGAIKKGINEYIEYCMTHDD